MKKGIFILLIVSIAFLCVFILPDNTDKIKLIIDNKQFILKTADTDTQRSKGLSRLSTLPKNQGMLFVYNDKEVRYFWMKDTYIPLQLVFVDGCRVTQVVEMPVETDPNNPKNKYTSEVKVDKAIEVNSGTFNKDIVGQGINDLCDL